MSTRNSSSPPEVQRRPTEFDRRTASQDAGAAGARTRTRTTVEARERSRIRGGPPSAASGCGGTLRSSSARARSRSGIYVVSAEPVPPIPDIYLSTTNCTNTLSLSSNPANVSVTRTRSSPRRSSCTGERGIERGREREETETETGEAFTTAISRSTSRARGRGITRTTQAACSKKTRVGETGTVTQTAAVSAATPKFKRRRRQSLPLLLFHANSTNNFTPDTTMPRSVASSDIFLDIARENSNRSNTMTGTPSHHAHHRSLSRTSYVDKRRSLPLSSLADTMPRPSTSSGNPTRPQPRFSQHVSRASTDLQRHMDQYSSPRLQQQNEQNDGDISQVGGSGRRRGFTAMLDTHSSPLSPRSQEVSQFGRRRPSFGVMSPSSRERRQMTLTAQDYSQDESNENEQQKQVAAAAAAESASGASSQSVDTVWDELDDLKSRIKKLELTGKLPPTSSAAVSGGSGSDRPRTATTAPTTIDSSPKQGRKQEQPPPPQPPPQAETPTTTPNTPAAGSTAAHIHPLLHAALAKAKPLLNSTLFRSLQATADDALQLAALTGSAGPQGTTFSAASIINGVTVNDRHVRRKADNMCRNLTDLCLALCEGKHEAPVSAFSSPAGGGQQEGLVLQRSPSLRYTPRSGLGSASTIRPASRLEARRSSILGAPPSTASDISPRGSVGELSGYEGEFSPPQQYPIQHHQRGDFLQAPPRTSRTPGNGSRLVSRSRLHHETPSDVSGNEDEGEDPTIRPLSRAMTDAGSFRSRPPRVVSESRTPGPGQHRAQTFRDSFSASHRGFNEESYESNNRVASYGAVETPRYSSGEGQRRRQSQLFYNTPSTVVEEVDDPTIRGGEDFQTALQGRRRVMSSQQQQFSSSQQRRRGEVAAQEAQQRSGGGGGLQQRRFEQRERGERERGTMVE